MVKSNYVHGAYHIQLESEMNRVFKQCHREGIFISKKDASALVAEKSKRGIMNTNEIKQFLIKLKGIIGC